MNDDEDLYRAAPDATDLSPEERVGLIPTWIVTRDDLNPRRTREYRRRPALGPSAALRRPGPRTAPHPASTHVWRHLALGRRAGAPPRRTSDEPIGGRCESICTRCSATSAPRVEHGGRDADAIALDFHHQLVAIHVFPNGNGRHARLAADLLAERLDRVPYSWGRKDLVDVGDARAAYVAALRAADRGDLDPLLAFARS